MDNVSKRINALSPKQYELFLKKLAQQKERTRDVPSSLRRKDATYPLSFGQQQLWFLEQLAPGNLAYSIPVVIHLEGSLQHTVLKECLHQIIQRHEILRTTFPGVEGIPQQKILSTFHLPLKYVDLQVDENEQQAQDMEQLLTHELHQPFDLASGPLFRGVLFQRTPQEHFLLLIMHHIIFDGWSLGRFIHELGVLYSAISTGKQPILPDLPIQYVDFTLWQHQQYQGERLEALLSYWKKQLEGIPPFLSLPLHRPRPVKPTFQGATHTFQITGALIQQLRTLCQREKVTLFMVLLTVFQIQLFRYSGQTDIVVGTPIANRTHSDLESLIGFFVNMLAVRTKLKPNQTFWKLLQQVKDVLLGAYAHQDLPFELLIEAIHPQRISSYNPIFQVMFALQSGETSFGELPDLKATLLPIQAPKAQFDLALKLREEGDILIGEIEYNTDLFDHTTAVRMAGHFQQLVKHSLVDPDQQISHISLLTEVERHQLLITWNQSESDHLQEYCVYELFEAQVRQSPEALALIWEEHCLTYHQLNSMANRLAHRLQTFGVGPETLVGIYLERSPELIICLLGILKAGGAYAPLEVGELWNLYGPTETTVWSTAALCSPRDTLVTIGFPIEDTQVYVLDAELEPVPIGVSGELYIGGAGLARGYLHLPDLTAEKFIPSPFSGKAGRLYRTGDLVRYRPDGKLEYLERVDRQVKVRGFRIEQGEIEATLRRHPAVKDAAVLLVEAGPEPGDTRLISYIATQEDASVSPIELRSFVQNQLPNFMVPSEFILLEQLPQTPNGKLDRRVLSSYSLEGARKTFGEGLTPPRDAVELQLSRLFEDLLGISPVGIRENFFDLGGHSLLAVRLMARIKHLFKRELPLSILFQKGTVEQLAELLSQDDDSLRWSPLVSIQPKGTKPPLFFVHPFGGDVLCYSELSRSLDRAQPFYGLQCGGLDEEGIPYLRIEDMAAFYIDAIRTVQPHGPYYLGSWSLGGWIAFEIAIQLQNCGETVPLLVLIVDGPAPLESRPPVEYDLAAHIFEILAIFAAEAAEKGAIEETPGLLAAAELRLLSEEKQLSYFLNLCKQCNIIHQDAPFSWARRYIQMYASNTIAMERYSTRATYHGRLHLYRSSEEAKRETSKNLTPGWDSLAVTQVHIVPGNHFSLLRSPHAEVLARDLTACLDEAYQENEVSHSASIQSGVTPDTSITLP